MRLTTAEYQAIQNRLDASRSDFDPSGDSSGASDACNGKQEAKESVLHNLITAYCKSRMWLCFHGAMHKRAYRPLGEPDFIILAPGKVYFVEAKTAKGKLRPEQIGVAMLAERLGHKIHVVRSMKDFEAIVA